MLLLMAITAVFAHFVAIESLNVVGNASETEAIDYLRVRAEAGEPRPVIDRTYPLVCVAEAHAHADTGRKVGSVVIEV